MKKYKKEILLISFILALGICWPHWVIKNYPPIKIQIWFRITSLVATFAAVIIITAIYENLKMSAKKILGRKMRIGAEKIKTCFKKIGSRAAIIIQIPWLIFRLRIDWDDFYF